MIEISNLCFITCCGIHHPQHRHCRRLDSENSRNPRKFQMLLLCSVQRLAAVGTLNCPTVVVMYSTPLSWLHAFKISSIQHAFNSFAFASTLDLISAEFCHHNRRPSSQRCRQQYPHYCEFNAFLPFTVFFSMSLSFFFHFFNFFV